MSAKRNKATQATRNRVALHRAGSAAKCEGCGEPFETWDRIYRCVDCETQYHRHCLKKHFAVSKAEWVANAIAAINSGKINLALAILERHTEEEKCQPPNVAPSHAAIAAKHEH